MFQNAGENTVILNDGKLIFQKQSFQWLLEQLLPPNDRICGCEVWVPDTAMFELGKPKVIVKTDKDGFLI